MEKYTTFWFLYTILQFSQFTFYLKYKHFARCPAVLTTNLLLKTKCVASLFFAVSTSAVGCTTCDDRSTLIDGSITGVSCACYMMGFGGDNLLFLLFFSSFSSSMVLYSTSGRFTEKVDCFCS